MTTKRKYDDFEDPKHGTNENIRLSRSGHSWMVVNESLEGSPFRYMPIEVIGQIFSFLKSPVDICRGATVCKTFYKVTSPCSHQLDKSLLSASAWNHITELNLLGLDSSLTPSDVFKMMKATNGKLTKVELSGFCIPFGHDEIFGYESRNTMIEVYKTVRSFIKTPGTPPDKNMQALMFYHSIITCCPLLEYLRLTNIFFHFDSCLEMAGYLGVPLKVLKFFYCNIDASSQHMTVDFPLATLEFHKCVMSHAVISHVIRFNSITKFKHWSPISNSYQTTVDIPASATTVEVNNNRSHYATTPYAKKISARRSFTLPGKLSAAVTHLDLWGFQGTIAIPPLPNLTHLNLSETKFSVASFSQYLENIRELFLRKTEFTDSHLFSLSNAKFQHLRVLDLWGTKVTDNALPALINSTKLHTLILGNTGITNDGLKTIGELFHELKELNLRRCAITDEGIAELHACTKLQVLDIFGIPTITDQSLTHCIIKFFPNLKELHLSDSAIEDWQSIASLKSLLHLRSLTLQQPCVNDDCIQHLAQLPNLHTLDLQKSTISKRGLYILAKKGTIRKVNITKCDVAVPMSLYSRTPLINWVGTIGTTLQGLQHLAHRDEAHHFLVRASIYFVDPSIVTASKCLDCHGTEVEQSLEHFGNFYCMNCRKVTAMDHSFQTATCFIHDFHDRLECRLPKHIAGYAIGRTANQTARALIQTEGDIHGPTGLFVISSDNLKLQFTIEQFYEPSYVSECQDLLEAIQQKTYQTRLLKSYGMY